MHVVSLMDGQILKTRAITRLVRENQLNVEEFKKFRVAAHESNAPGEFIYDQMLFKDVVQKFLLQQKNNVKYESAESDSQVVHSSGLLHEAAASSTEGALPSACAFQPALQIQSTFWGITVLASILPVCRLILHLLLTN